MEYIGYIGKYLGNKLRSSTLPRVPTFSLWCKAVSYLKNHWSLPKTGALDVYYCIARVCWISSPHQRQQRSWLVLRVVNAIVDTSGISCQQRVIVMIPAVCNPLPEPTNIHVIKLFWRQLWTINLPIVKGINRRLHFSCCFQRESVGTPGRVPNRGLFLKYSTICLI